MSHEVELSKVYIIALAWYWRGWGVIPIQPNSKKVVGGFGINLRRISTVEELGYWFKDRNTNLGVIAPENGIILDFDDSAVYERFTGLTDLARTYTENTPRGGYHAFLSSTQSIPHLELVPGIEVKRLCVSYPSIVGGLEYSIHTQNDILRGDIAALLDCFTLNPFHDRAEVQKSAYTAGPPKSGLIAELKAKWGIAQYLRYFEPKLRLTGRGRFLSGLCPFHGDITPSLWVDTERGLWGCHACGAHGDIVNWHARRLGTNDIRAAVRDLARYNVQVGVRV